MINKQGRIGWMKKMLIVLVIGVLAVLAWPTIQQYLPGSGSDDRRVSGETQRATGNPGTSMGDMGADTNTRSGGSYGTVKRGGISVKVSGSGKVAAEDTRQVYNEAEGRVKNVDVKVGDTVQEGQILVQLASDDIENEIASLNRTLFDAQIALSEVRDSGSATSIYSPAAGRVKMMKAEVDDDVSTLMKQYSYLCVISRDGKMKVDFVPAPGVTFHAGDKVHVWIKSQAVEGTVSQAAGLTGGNISVTVPDDSYDVGEPAVVSTLLGEKLGEGTLAVNMPIPVTGIGGTISSIAYEENDTVGSGYKLFGLSGRTPSADLQKAILAYDEAWTNMTNAQKKQDNLLIRSPLTGVVTAVDAQVGAKLEEGSPAFTVQNTDSYKVTAAVDELYITQIVPGQSVTVELDAYPNRKFTATVDRISGVGTVEGGVATYDVTVTLDPNQGAEFMDGMTANIEVATIDKSSVLLAPVEAISTSNGQNYVTLASGVQQTVTTGESDGTNIEILSGVSEGDQVLLTRSAATNNVGTYSGASGSPGGNAQSRQNRSGAIMMPPGGF